MCTPCAMLLSLPGEMFDYILMKLEVAGQCLISRFFVFGGGVGASGVMEWGAASGASRMRARRSSSVGLKSPTFNAIEIDRCWTSILSPIYSLARRSPVKCHLYPNKRTEQRHN